MNRLSDGHKMMRPLAAAPLLTLAFPYARDNDGAAQPNVIGSDCDSCPPRHLGSR
jgi:hypothetical protein